MAAQRGNPGFASFKQPFTASVGANLRYMGCFASLLHPQEEKVGYYFQSGTWIDR